jgi:hypothetical protein
MKGHIRERSPGHCAIILDQRDPATGQRRRKWHSFKGPKPWRPIPGGLKRRTAFTGGRASYYRCHQGYGRT